MRLMYLHISEIKVLLQKKENGRIKDVFQWIFAKKSSNVIFHRTFQFLICSRHFYDVLVEVLQVSI